MVENKLNLDNPIFVVYLNGNELTSSSKQRLLDSCRQSFDYTNATFWFVIDNFNKIECVWDGKYDSRKPELLKLIKKINSRLEILCNCVDGDQLKKEVRELKLVDILEI